MNRRRFLKHVTALGVLGASSIGASLSLQGALPSVYGDSMSIPPLTNPVTIDGKWTTATEWTDGYEMPSPACNWRLKYDTDSLYVLSDFFGVNESFPTGYDAAWVYIDTLGNGSSVPDKVDYAFSIQPSLSNSLVMEQGTGSDWSIVAPNFKGASSVDPSNDPYGSSPHPIYEFKIPMSIFPANVKSAKMRLSTEAPFQGWYVWPRDSDRSDPSTWGDVEFSSTPIPEFSEPALVPLITLGLPLYVLSRYRKRRQSIAP